MEEPAHLVNIPVEGIERAISRSLESDQSWNLFLNNGAMETIIAGSHQGRYLLELLQNARDAASKDDAGHNVNSGKALVLINEKGILVVNTGQAFHLDQQKVLNAVCNIDQSTKGSKDYIGHKGIGMKSIRLQASAFSVITSLDGYGVRVDFSRADTARFCLKAAADYDEHCEERVYASLPRLPLFSLPFIGKKRVLDSICPVQTLLDLAGLSHNEISILPKELLQASSVTIVSLWFEDDGWNDLLDEAETHLTTDLLHDFRNKRAEQKRDSTEQDETVWKEVKDIRPETIILMDVLDQVDFIDMQDGEVKASRQVAIRREPVDDNSGHSLAMDIIHVREHLENLETETRFLLIRQANELDEDEHQPRLLFPFPTHGHPQPLESQPLYMYYPIRHQFSGLPFILHGRFKVSPERTQLYFSDSKDTHNDEVIKSAMVLFENFLHALPEIEALQVWRGWLPWLLIPGKAAAQTGSVEQKIENQIREQIAEIMKRQEWIPTAMGKRRPADVLYMQEYPRGYCFLNKVDEDCRHFALLSSDSLNCRDVLIRESDKNYWSFDETLIGLGQMANAEFIDSMICFWEVDELRKDNFPDPENAGIDFFKIVCTLLKSLNEPAKIKEKAMQLGRVKAAMVPVQQEQGGSTLLRAVNKNSQGKEKLRVIFCPPYGEEGDIHTLPSSAIEVYFMPRELASFLEDEGFRPIFIDCRDAWGINRYDNRADLFRRVSEWMDELSNSGSPDRGDTVKVIGYLAGLLNTVQQGKGSDLQPVPYTHVDVPLLRETFGADKVKAKDSREKLLRKQGWLRISLPAEGQAESQMAGDLVFGPEWADLLRNETGDGDEEAAYADLIDLLPDLCPGNPQVLSPNDAGWEPALQIVQKFQSESTKIQHTEKIALFRLLLLIGVRVGPRIEWRWLDKMDNMRPDDQIDHALQFAKYQQRTGLPKLEILLETSGAACDLPTSGLYDQYQKWILTNPYHPKETVKFTGYSYHHRDSLSVGEVKKEYLTSVVWLPDLMSGNPINPVNQLDFSKWFDKFVRFGQKAFEPVLNSILDTGWYSTYDTGFLGWNIIPTLAKYQLTHLPLWTAKGNAEILPAYCFVSTDETEEFLDVFPRMLSSYTGKDNSEGEPTISPIEQIIGICPIKDMNLVHVVEHLGWLLKNSNLDHPANQSTWEINHNQAPMDTLRTLFKRIAELIDDSSPYLLRTCNLTVPAVESATSKYIAVRYGSNGFVPALQYFDRSPAEWQKQQLKEENAHIFLSDKQGLPSNDNKLIRWANSMRMTPVKNERKASVYDDVTTPEAIQILQQAREQVMDRIGFLMGFIKGNRAQESGLREDYEKLCAALQGMRVIQEPLGFYPLGENKTLLLSLDDYGDGTNAECLAFGLVLVLGTESLLESFILALSADPATLDKVLSQKNVRMDELKKELPDLFEWSLLAQANKLLKAFGIESLKATEKAQVLHQASARLDLPIEIIKLALTGKHVLDTARRISAEIRGVGWEIGRLEQFLVAIFPDLMELLRQQNEFITFFNRLAIAQAVLMQPTERIWQEVAREKWEKLSRKLDALRPSNLINLEGVVQLGLVDLIEAQGHCPLLVDWREEQWEALSTHLCHALYEEMGDQEEYATVFSALKEGRVPEEPVKKGEPGDVDHLNPRQTMLRQYLDDRLFSGTWSDRDLIVPISAKPEVVLLGNYGSASNSESGRRKKNTITPRMEERGELAEFFIIHLLWTRFWDPNLPQQERIRMIEKVTRFRNDHPYWGNRVRWNTDRLRLEAVMNCLNGQRPVDEREMHELFQRSVDLSDIGLAGFDVLDPTSEPEHQIEIKSVVDLKHPSIWMTTHEFHMAKKYGSTYILRLVCVPENISNLGGYRYVDIANPYEELNLAGTLPGSVSGGKFFFGLTLE